MSFSVVDIFGPIVGLFKCLDFKTFCFVVIYIIVAKNLFIYKIVLGAGPREAPRGGDEAR